MKNKKMKILSFMLLLLSHTVWAQSTVNPDSVCFGSTSESYWVSANPLASFSWSVNVVGASITAGQGTEAIVVDWSGVAAVGLYVNAITLTETTNLTGCSASIEIDVELLALPVISAGTDQTACENDAVVLSGSGGVGATYTWNNGVTDGVSFVSPVGTTTYTATGTDIYGCVNTDQVDVLVNPLPSINAGVDQAICDNHAVTLSGSGGGVGATYVWDNSVLDGISFVPSVGTITYTVTGTDANTCVNTDQVDVLVNSLPSINAGLDQTVCENDAVTLNGSGGVSYVWDNSVLDGISFVSPVGTTTYTVTGTDANSCANTDQVDVLVNPLPNISAGLDVEVCENDAVTLSGSGGVSYVWNNGVLNGISFIPPLGTTTYTVTGTDANTCVNTDQVAVVSNPIPTPGPIQHN